MTYTSKTGGFGALIQIRLGWKSLKLTNNPEISYFKFKYSRYYHFAIESFKEKINGNVSANSTVTSIISRNLGDLVYKTWLELELPPVISTTDIAGDADTWVTNTDYKENDVVSGVTEISFEAQGNQINNLTSSTVLSSYVCSAMNSDGTTFITGSYTNNSESGDIKIFNYDSSTKIITQEFIDLGLPGYKNGQSVAINDAGDMVASGAIGANGDAGLVRTFKKISNVWTALPEIVNATPGEMFGTSVSMNGDGTILAVGAPYATVLGFMVYAGYVKIYEFNGTNWIQKGLTLMGQGVDHLFGHSISLSQSGTRVFIGAPVANTNGTGYVFDWNGSTFQFGNSVIGPAGDAKMGTKISCNSAGTRFALESKENAGLIRVYDLIGSTWTQRGTDFIGENSTSFIGETLCELTYDGNTLFYESRKHNNSRGYIKVFELSGNTWNLIFTIEGTIAGETLGMGSSISRDFNSSIIVSCAHGSNLIGTAQYHYIIPPDTVLMACTKEGTSGINEPTWNINNIITDNTVSWQNTTSPLFYPSRTLPTFYDMIDFIQIQIGDNIIDKHSGKWLQLYYDLHCVDSKKSGLDQITTLLSNKSTLNKPMQKARLPFAFWYCKDTGSAIPLISLYKDDVKITIKFSNNLSATGAELWVDYIHLDKPEKLLFEKNNQEYLIEQLQTNTTNLLKNRLHIFHPIKEIFWTLDNNNLNKLTHAEITINDQRFVKRDANYFKQLQPYYHHSGISNNEVFMFSFSLNPDNFQPSGSINFSRLDSAYLNLTGNITSPTVNIYAVNYNILQIRKGKAKLEYNNFT